MKVWIDQERCTGDAQCADVCPEVFFMHEGDGAYLGYVKRAGDSGCDPTGAPTLRMSDGRAHVPRLFEAAVIEAAELCPGECIVLVPGD
jgi:ferredoxin